MLETLQANVTSRTLATVGLAVAAGILLLKPWQKRYKLPPYPWIRVPVIGNIISLMRIPEKAFMHFYKISRNPKYGKIFMIQLGGRDVCVVNDIDIAREAFINKALDFGDRPDFFSINSIVNGKDIAFSHYGDVWKFHRKVAHKAMRNFASGEVLERLIQKATLSSIEAMEKNGDKPFVLKPYIELLIFNLFVGISYGKTFDIDDPEFRQFTNLTRDMLAAFGSGVPADVFPWLSFVPFQGMKLRRMIGTFVDFLRREFKEHKETFDPENLRDLTDYLLLTQKEAEEEDKSMKGALTDEHLVMTVFDIFGAGIDTMNATIQSTIADNITFPERQELLYKETDAVVGDRLPTLADRQNLPQTEAFLYETMRYHTFGVFGVPLATYKDTTLAGFELPKGTTFVVNFWALHHDSDHWDSPETFRPERFLTDDGQLGPRPVSFLPFSAGKRVCIGENLAKAQLLMILPMMLQKFKFYPGPGFEYCDEDSGLANLPKPYSVIVKPRRE